MLSDDILFKPVGDLSKLVRARQISPVELTRACLDRIDRLDSSLHAFVTLTPDLALEQARQAEREIASGRDRGALHGIPYGAKDLVATKGIRTTWGAKPYEHQLFAEDATVVRRLRDAGAVLVGKLAMIELAGGLDYARGDASLTGAAHNPWNLKRWTCGSSSGSGAAVSAALVPFAIGSETWGSIICPSTYCGISGLRPTFGRVSRRGAMALSWSLDKLGPMARSARDCEIVLRAMEGHDPEDQYSADEPPGPQSDPAAARRFRAGFLKPDWDKYGDKSVRRAFEKALADLEAAGLRLEETKLPDLPFESATLAILYSEACSAFEELERSGGARQLATPTAFQSFIIARAIRGSDLVKAQRIRTLCQRAMADFFGRHDVLLFPGDLSTAPPWDKDFSEGGGGAPDPAGAAGNLCGLPAVAVPCGFADDQLPASLTIMSGAFEEAKAVALGRLFQGITSWHTKRPPLTTAA